MIYSSGQPGPEIAATRSSSQFWWALLVTLVLVFLVTGFLQEFPFNVLLWGISIAILAIFVFLVYRSTRSPAKLEFAEVRRLIVCDQCKVESEGPYESGDHVFREIGPCPRCDGKLIIKAIYSIDSKTPLKRQQPQTETPSSVKELSTKS
ncbi:MAG: hypothetical protein ACFFD8_01070 [Candidatus Thorarchaeota archaeon]